MVVRRIEELEPRRGCGFRKLGKLYLVGEGRGVGCHRVPLPMDICPTCVPPGTIISGDYKPIETMMPGDAVFGNGRIERVTNGLSRTFNGELVTIIAEGLLPITVTPDHPIRAVYVRFGGHHGLPIAADAKWIPAGAITPKVSIREGHLLSQSLRAGHYLTIPRLCHSVKLNQLNVGQFAKRCNIRVREFLPLNAETARVMGLYVAEGFDMPKGIRFCFGKHETALAAEVSGWAHNIGYSSMVKQKRTALIVEIASRVLGRAFAEWFGHGAAHKRIPDAILLAEPTILQAFLIGYEAGDGSKRVNKGVKIVHSTTVSRTLALQIQLAWARLGVFARIYFTKRSGPSTIEGRAVTIRDLYEIFRKVEGERNDSNLPRVRKDVILARVRAIVRQPYNGQVYNLSTTDHTFLLSNALVHNCGEGIRQTRNIRWVDARRLWGECVLPNQSCHGFASPCPCCFPPERAGVLGVGERFYSPLSFIEEAQVLGAVSKAINSVPKGLKLGESWIFLVHPEAGGRHVPDPEDPNGEPVWKVCPGVFYAFQPTRIEMLVTASDATEEKVEELEERGITVVIVPDDYEQRVDAELKKGRRQKKEVNENEGQAHER